MILVDQPGTNRVSGEGGTTHRNIVMQFRLQAANYLGIEFPLETRLPCGDGLQRFGINDLVSGLSDPREVQDGRRPAWNDIWRLPNRHGLVHFASIEIRADEGGFILFTPLESLMFIWRREVWDIDEHAFARDSLDMRA